MSAILSRPQCVNQITWWRCNLHIPNLRIWIIKYFLIVKSDWTLWQPMWPNDISLISIHAFILVSVTLLRHMHDDVIKWKHFPRNWPFVREIHRSPVNFPHKGQWRGALMFSLIYASINDWVNNREAGDLKRQHGHYDVIVMWTIRRLKSLTSRVSVHQLVQASKKQNIKSWVLLALWEGNPMDDSHTGPKKRKVCPWHYSIIQGVQRTTTPLSP